MARGPWMDWLDTSLRPTILNLLQNEFSVQRRRYFGNKTVCYNLDVRVVNEERARKS
jgi:hypothetical protein